MDFLLGLLTGAVFFICLIGAYYIGTRKKQTSSIPVDDEVKRRQKEMHKHFQELMTYDVTKAVQRKKVM